MADHSAQMLANNSGTIDCSLPYNDYTPKCNPKMFS